ncbi:MAG: penicillin-binding protein activator [Pseudomonadota bacterium]
MNANHLAKHSNAARNPLHVARRWFVACAVVCSLLSGCESIPGSTGSLSATRAERLLMRGDYERAAVQFMQLAGSVSGSARDPYLLGAADAWIAAGDSARARAALDQVSTPPAADIRNRWHIARTSLFTLVGDGPAAIAALSEIDKNSLSLDERIRAEAARGSALFLVGKPADAIATLQQREIWLGSTAEVAANDQLIWDGLLQSAPDALRGALQDATDIGIAGWLALGLLADGTQPGGPQRGLAGWQRQYPGHPALRHVVPGIDAVNANAMNGMPSRIAVLLTSSGRSAIVGQAVRDGLLSAYAQRYRGQLNAPTITMYDITENGATIAYQQAINEGAQFIVGPVLRSAVEELAAYTGPTVPTLLLNYPTTQLPLPIDFFCFGLAPEDEAAAVAMRAYAEGHRRAVALVPASNWGERVLQAFNREFTALGGQTLTYEQYIGSETDHKDEIQRAMLLTDSVSRYRNIRATLGGTLQFEPRRRDDADFIFMAANAESARRLKPQFRFHYAGDLPVYATSNVNDVKRRRPDTDLNGVRFTDISWLVKPLRDEPTPLTLLRDYFPAANSQPRLFALGFDALGVVAHIAEPLSPDTQEGEHSEWQGATGMLSLGRNGHVRRQTDWAVFASGEPAALDVLQLPRPTFERVLVAPQSISDDAPPPNDD